jgi:WD40 repeat protein
VTDSEWATQIGDLAETGQWDEMWRLTQTAPGIWAQRMVMRLAWSNWQPNGTGDRSFWPLISSLAKACAGTPIPAIGSGSSLVHHCTSMDGVNPVFGPDGQSILTKEYENGVPRTYRLFGMPGGVLIKDFRLNSSSTRDVKFSSNGRIFVSTELDPDGCANTQLWDIATGKHIVEIPGSGSRLEFSPDGSVMLLWHVGSNVAELYQLPAGNRIGEFNKDRPKINFLKDQNWETTEFSPDGAFVSTASYPDFSLGTTDIWHLPDGKHVREIKGCHSKFSPDSKRLAVFSKEPLVHELLTIYQQPDFSQQIRQLVGYNPEAAYFSSDGAIFIAPGKPVHEDYCRIYDLHSQEQCRFVNGTWSDKSPDGRILATYIIHNGNSSVHLWQLPECSPILNVAHHNVHLMFSPDNRFVAIKQREPDCTHIYSLPGGEHVGKVDGLFPQFSPNGKYLLTWSDRKNHAAWCQTTNDHNLDNDSGVAYLYGLPDGRYIATITKTRVQTEQEENVWAGCDDIEETYGFSPCGDVLTTVSEDTDFYSTHIWRLADGQCIKTLPGSESDFSPDGQWLAVRNQKQTDIWCSRLTVVTAIPRAALSSEDHVWMANTVGSSDILEAERLWLEFMIVLTDHHRRFDIEISNASPSINTDEFDIEIKE